MYYVSADGDERVVFEFQGQEARSRSAAVGLALNGLDGKAAGVDLRVHVRPDPDSVERSRLYPHCVQCGSELLICGRCVDCGSDRVIGVPNDG